MRCVAVCCSALQYVAVRCSVLQCVAVYLILALVTFSKGLHKREVFVRKHKRYGHEIENLGAHRVQSVCAFHERGVCIQEHFMGTKSTKYAPRGSVCVFPPPTNLYSFGSTQICIHLGARSLMRA